MKKKKESRKKEIKEMSSKEYNDYVKKKANEINLTTEDVRNFTDLGFMICNECRETLKLSKMERWFDNFTNKCEKISLVDLYSSQPQKKK
ncbi:MAG: hypothetical protein WD512_06965 [Candidatus Paceibacterota bacterium]